MSGSMGETGRESGSPGDELEGEPGGVDVVEKSESYVRSMVSSNIGEGARYVYAGAGTGADAGAGAFKAGELVDRRVEEDVEAREELRVWTRVYKCIHKLKVEKLRSLKRCTYLMRLLPLLGLRKSYGR